MNYKETNIIIGSKADLIENKINECTHDWICYVRAPPSIVKSVQFKLHESFANPIINKTYPFEIKESGWGEFNIQIKITLFNDDKINTNHYLSLYAENYPAINERVDSLIFKDKNVPEYENIIIDDEEEYKKINKAIDYLLLNFDLENNQP